MKKKYEISGSDIFSALFFVFLAMTSTSTFYSTGCLDVMEHVPKICGTNVEYYLYVFLVFCIPYPAMVLYRWLNNLSINDSDDVN